MVTDPGITTRCPVDLPLVDEQNADSGNALSAEESNVTTAGCGITSHARVSMRRKQHAWADRTTYFPAFVQLPR